ncbi:hypothetical protein LMG22037_05697 [Paraburkholderia phenoliruptrix]|uniref:DUF4123 domain-containing protein n=1 Tax=Paraburkholderia phenoliruptrix TaxID=252970 RepID=A0A6J5CC76_9BURK|nr:DUF4123 domain-containing protein [Paraburkholderia phenoliruptrix]CAB3732346.1 hypothetical protein LMG22037_05697 [Paraburkholderia phenoliruptrix]
MESLNYRNSSVPRAEANAKETAVEVPVLDQTVGVLRAYFSQHPQMHCLVVIDPSRLGFPESLEQKIPVSEQPHALVTIAHEAFPDEHRPYLVELNLSTPDGVELLVETVRLAFEDRHPDSIAQGLGQRIGGWLASNSPAEVVAGHWSQQVLQVDDRGRQCALRFYDSRALSLLWTMLSPGQRQALLGPISAWHALDACAKPCMYTNTDTARADLTLKDAQWREIRRHGLINRAIGLHMQAVGRQPDPQEVDAAVASAARAEQYGLSDRDDIVAFIGHALAWHPQFDRYPKVTQALQQREPDDFYTAVVSELSAEEIKEIQRGNWVSEKLFSSAAR